MKKRVLALLLALFLLPAGCSSPPAETAPGPETLSVAAATWPVYCFATAVTQGAQGVQVAPVINQPISCLHDYTLSVSDMRVLEGADLVLLNGAGLEEFMSDALSASQAQAVDCSQAVELLSTQDGEPDPHIWMDPQRAAAMVSTIAEALAQADPDQAQLYRDNADACAIQLNGRLEEWRERLSGLTCRELITFHDGFAYFAQALDLTILRSIEEEEGSEASAQEIQALISLVQERHLPAIFTEVNGSDATAQAIARETGTAVYPLSMVMSGEGEGLDPYLEAMDQNIAALEEALS